MISDRTAASVALLVRRELDDDYVGIWVLPWHIRRLSPAASDDEVREISIAVLAALLGHDAAIGDLNEETGIFYPWSADDAVDRVTAVWRTLDRDPNVGEIAWLAHAR